MDVLRISTDALPSGRRLEMFREIFGRKILKIDIEPDASARFEADMILQGLPGLGVGAGSLSPMCNRLSRDLIDNDDLVLVILQAGAATVRQNGREQTLTGGQAIMTANDAPASFTGHTPTQLINLRLGRSRLAAQLADAGASVLRPISGDNPALRLLASYLHAVSAELPRSPENLRQMAADHIYDLVALALGAHRDAGEAGRLRGVRAARLDAVLRLIRSTYEDPRISPASVAVRLGISTRYLHKLLHETGSSFAERVQELRLARAFALLSGEDGAARKVNDAAYAAGFNDLSHFHRLFRRKYGLTPTAARGRGDGLD
jgi:AraC-like DNA-binding protein